MKILLVSPYFYPLVGGVQEHVYNLYLYLKKRGYYVKILTSNFLFAKENDNLNLKEANKDIIRVGISVPFYINKSWAQVALPYNLSDNINRILQQEQFDLIHIHEPLAPTLPLFTLKLAAKLKIKTVGTFHAYSPRSILYFAFKNYLKKYFNLLDGRICVSCAAKKFINKYFNDNDKIVVIPNGINIEKFNTSIAPLERFKDEKKNILFVGRFDKRKGVKYLLAAFEIVRKKMHNVRLIMVGSSKKPFYLKEKEIYFEGRRISDINRYYRSADIFCAPSIGWESFGIILLEAMASGVPVVASSIPGYNEVIEHGKNGILVKPKEPYLLAEAIINLLNNEELRNRLIQAGLRKAYTYRWEEVAKKILLYYKQII